LKTLHRLLVREGQRVLDDLAHRPIGVRAWRVDPGEERVEERALARCDLRQPAPEGELRVEEGVRASVCAHEDEAANELGLPERQLLCDGASHREAGDVGGGNFEGSEDGGRVIRHDLRRDRALRQRGSPCPTIVEGGHAVAVGEAIQLELPRLDGVAEAPDQQDVRSFADLLGPDVEVTGADVVTHFR
jgi:hypothetical protein